MELNSDRTRRGLPSLLGIMLGLAALALTSVTSAQEAPVGLGTAESVAVLAGAGVTNTGPTIINGNLAACPTPAVTGFPPGTVNGTIHAGDAVCLEAQSDLTIAYNDAAGRAPTTTFPGVTDLGGQTLTPGVYKADAFAITGTLTLDAQGDPNAVWIFQAGSTLITAPYSRVVLINGAQACNVFWQVGSSATLGVGSTFVGTILALTSITANTNADVQGRLLARNGAVTLDSNTVTRPVCAPTPTSTSSTATSSTTTSSTTTVPPTTVPPVTVPPITVAPTTIPPITVPPTTVPPVTVPPITVAPTTTSTTTLPDTITTTSTTRVADTTTTTIGGDDTGATGEGATATTSSTTTSSSVTPTTSSTTTSPETTTTTSTTPPPATGASTTTTAAGGTTTTTASGGVAIAGGAGGRTLARTGSSVRWGQFWSGVALAVGGVMVLLTRQDLPVRRRQGGDGT